MSSSCYGNANIMENSNIMSQSLDPTILRQTVTPSKVTSDLSCHLEKCLGILNFYVLGVFLLGHKFVH